MRFFVFTFAPRLAHTQRGAMYKRTAVTKHNLHQHVRLHRTAREDTHAIRDELTKKSQQFHVEWRFQRVMTHTQCAHPNQHFNYRSECSNAHST
jgi:hypothetical protein